MFGTRVSRTSSVLTPRRTRFWTIFAEKGYLRAQLTPEVLARDDHKLVRFDLRPGTRYRDVKIVSRRRRKRPRPGHPGTSSAAVSCACPFIAILAGRRKRSGDFTSNAATLRQVWHAPVHELDAERRTGKIVIPVDEGPVFRVGALQFSGNTALTAEDLRAGLPLETGAVFEPARLEPASTALKLKYGKLGYGDADIDYEIDRHDDAPLWTYPSTVVENKQTSIGAVNVEGNRHTSADFARSQLRVAAGEVANTALIRESAKNLAQTGAYASTDIQLQPPYNPAPATSVCRLPTWWSTLPSRNPSAFSMEASMTRAAAPGLSLTFRITIRWARDEFWACDPASTPKPDEARLYVTRPFWRQHRLSTTIGTYFTRRDRDTTRPARPISLGVSIQQDLPLRSKWLLSYGYRFEKQRGFVPDPSAPDIKADVVSVAPVTFTISRDTRDSFLDATRGSFISHGFELAPEFLGSDYPYARYYVQYFKYFPLTRPRPVPFGEQPQRSRFVFASGSRLGLQKGFNEEGAVLTDRFYAGGGTTVRGFRQDELGPKLANGQPAGGNAVLVLNNELRFPLFWIFDAVTFVDVGNVFPRVSDFSFSELRGAGGFGLRIRNPFVVLRFDYGLKFERRAGEKAGAFFFSIGQAF